jgi:hypothetical protein
MAAQSAHRCSVLSAGDANGEAAQWLLAINRTSPPSAGIRAKLAGCAP